MPTFRDWLTSVHHRCRRWTWLATGLGTVMGLCIIAQAGLLARIIHQAFIAGVPRSELTVLFGLFVGVILLRAALFWVREVCGQKASSLVRGHLRRQLLDHLQRLGPAYVGSKQTAQLAGVVMERVESLHGYIAHYLPQKNLALLLPAMIAAAAFTVSWMVGLVFLLTAPLIPLFMIMIGRGADKLNRKNFHQLERMSAHFLDTLQGLVTLKIFQRSQPEAQRIAASSDSYRQGTMAVLRVAFLSSAVLEFLTSVAIAMTAVYLGLSYLNYLDFGLYARELTLETGLFLLLLAPDMYQPLRELGTHYHARAEALGAATEIHQLLARPAPAWSAPGASAPTAWAVAASRAIKLECRQVGYAYDHGRRPALTDLSLEVPAGQWLAIVGASGAGKTTLLNLLLQFLPQQQGEILVDGIPLRHFSRQAWHQRIAWIPQQPALFHGSVAANITLDNPDITAETIEESARRAGLCTAAGVFEIDLTTNVGEQGAQLSGGQVRRVALARAFARNAQLLLLDEPTAGLDEDNEQGIIRSLRELAPGRTLIMLTHRLAAARAADRIAVIEDGTVVEQGTHTELMALRGRYAELVRSGQEMGS